MAWVSRHGGVGICCAFASWVGAVQAAEIELRPISASGTHSIAGNEIFLTGSGQRVFLELYLSDWDPDLKGNTKLKIWQVTFDSTGYTSGLGVAIGPAEESCSDPTGCVSAFGTDAVCAVGCNGGDRDGQTCTSDEQCPGNPPGVCGFSSCVALFQDFSRDDWIFVGLSVVTAVAVSTPDFRVGALALSASAFDPGTPGYGGTLVLDVPPGAAGTYTIGFIEGRDSTFMTEENDGAITPLNLIVARITVECVIGADCNDNNECTIDSCNADGSCTNLTNFDDTQFCCNPATGGLTSLSDSNACTLDVCNPNGSVTHPPEAEFTTCGDTTNTQCDNPDSCDGTGACLNRLEPNGASCGSAVDTDCDGRDTCNGNGVCLDNIKPAGATCGSQADTECDDPDICNGFGTCLVNTVPNGVPCDDGLFCTADETCTDAVCTSGAPRDCADLLSCTTDTCNDTTDQCDHSLNAGSCLIDNICYAEGDFNPANSCEACTTTQSTIDWTTRSNESLCNDGDACTGTGRPDIGFDTCTAGVCAGTLDPECNDDCEFPVVAVEGSTISNNSSTGPDDGEASCQIDSNNDVWFQYTAKCAGTIFLSTTGSIMAPSNDPVLNVFDACPADGGVEIACDDDSGVELQAALTFTVSAGATYLIRVAGFEDNRGSIVLNLRPIDDCLIDGVCFAEDDLNPENACLACIPDLSTTQWSPLLEGSSCGDSEDTECDSPDACDGLGFCEVNHKPDGIECADEVPANECTRNMCNQGLCVHPPEPAGFACGDPSDTECDNPDICDGGGTCTPDFEDIGFSCGDQTETQCDNPDICDGNNNCLDNPKPNGLACDDLDVCTKEDACQSGSCAGTAIPEAPLVAGLGSRAIVVTPQPPNSPAPVALLLTSPDWTCLSKYIDVDGLLVDTPVFQLPAQWGDIIVQDPDIVPSSTYVVTAECGGFQSPASSGDTWLWGDMNNDGTVSFTDINLIVEAFKSIFTVPFIVANLAPCDLDDMISFKDIGAVVEAFKQIPFPCAIPCP